eukprot:12724-Heterococcus_DN1.PRE.4
MERLFWPKAEMVPAVEPNAPWVQALRYGSPHVAFPHCHCATARCCYQQQHCMCRATISSAVEKAASALPAFAAAFDKYTPWLNIDVDAYIAQLNLMTPGVQLVNTVSQMLAVVNLSECLLDC